MEYAKNIANHKIRVYEEDGEWWMVDDCSDHPMESTARLCESYAEAVNYARLAENIVEAQNV